MRIICEKCSAAYAIDDRLITPRGVRAQCPKCRHLQLVKRVDGSDAVTAVGLPPPPPATTPVATPRLPPEAFANGPVARPEPPRPTVEIRPPVVPPQARGPSAPLSGEFNWDALDPAPGPEPAAAPKPAAPPPSPPPPAVPSATRAPPPPEVDDSLLGPSGPPVEATAGCRDCGKPLTDPFDQAIGICDSCRGKAKSGDLELELDDKPATHAAAVSAPAVTASRVAQPNVPASPPERARPAPPPNPSAVMTASRGDSRPEGGAGKWVVALLLLVLVAGGAAAFLLRDRLFGGNKNEDAAQALPNAVAAALPGWKMAHVDVDGTAAQHLEEGRKLLREDRASSYSSAVDSFQKALILDPQSDAAIAGYVKALALGTGPELSDGAWEEAQALASAAQKRSGRSPETVLANAHLLLARPRGTGNLEQARALAEEVLAKSKDPALLAEAEYVIGRSWLSSSSALAAERFTRALELDPELRIARFQRALAYAGSGNYQGALADLERRLELNPDHWESNEALARLYREAGQPDRARGVYQSVLEKNPEHPRAKLAMAVFRYQAEGRAAEALTELRLLAKNLEAFSDPEQAEILTHLATVERLAGSENAAVEAAQQALEKAPEQAAPHLQLFLIAIKRGLVTDAERHFEALKGKLGDEAMVKLLEGRLRMAQSRFADAAKAFREAAAADKRRLDALFLSGLAWAQAGQQPEAYKVLFEASKSDPSRLSPPNRSPLWYFDPARFLRGQEGKILALKTSEQDVPAMLYEGVLRYHLGDFAAARRLTREATDLDTNNPVAHAWNALAALKQKDVKGAVAAGAQASRSGRQVAIAHFANGLALAASGRDEEARRALREALTLDPGLLGAEQKLAELDVARKDLESARKRLTQIVTLDPSWWPAKELLFSIDKEMPREGAGPR